jgi:hypothetical protein
MADQAEKESITAEIKMWRAKSDLIEAEKSLKLAELIVQEKKVAHLKAQITLLKSEYVETNKEIRANKLDELSNSVDRLYAKN